MTDLDRLLESYRTAAISERDKGTAFEKLVTAWPNLNSRCRFLRVPVSPSC